MINFYIELDINFIIFFKIQKHVKNEQKFHTCFQTCCFGTFLCFFKFWFFNFSKKIFWASTFFKNFFWTFWKLEKSDKITCSKTCMKNFDVFNMFLDFQKNYKLYILININFCFFKKLYKFVTFDFTHFHFQFKIY